MQMANKHLKRCSTALIIRDMQIKTTMRYHLTLARMTIIKKSINHKCWRECGRKRTLFHCWWEYKLISPLWKTEWRFLKKKKKRKLGIKPPYDPAIPLLGLNPEETKTERDSRWSLIRPAVPTQISIPFLMCSLPSVGCSTIRTSHCQLFCDVTEVSADLTCQLPVGARTST